MSGQVALVTDPRGGGHAADTQGRGPGGVRCARRRRPAGQCRARRLGRRGRACRRPPRGRLRGAALDVFETEPQVAPELLSTGRLLAVPHIGAATTETRLEMGRLVVANLDAHLAGRPLPTRVA